MAVSNQVLLIVSILEGRRFPRRSKHQVIVEAKFDGETLCTDPIDHTESPNFTTELAWELDKKALHQHKLQRTPIKLQCYAIDTVLSQKEMVGYIILDLRSAQAKIQRPQWFPLLNSKYQRLKPELQVRLNLEDDSGKKPDQNSLPQHSTPTRKDGIDPLALKPILNDEKGFYQLGPMTESAEIFVFSVTISYAVNLAKLIPSSFVVPDGQGFYFQYSLFGNKVSSEIFSDLLQPNFSPERASVRINSQLKLLRAFLQNFPGITITLYCAGRPLGETNISLRYLLPTDEPLKSPAILEALFPLTSTEDPRSGSKESPGVGVSILLKKEEANVPSEQETHLPPNVQRTTDSPQKTQAQDGYPGENQPFSEVTVSHTRNRTDEQPMADRKDESKISPSAGLPEGQPDESRLSFHHFCYSVDLRSICDLQVTFPVNCYLKYSYPFFGSATPVITSPPVEVRRHMEVLLPKSFCAFDFATNSDVLKETLSSVPLVIEIWHRDPVTKDVLLGVSRVTLGHVFAAKKLKAARGKPSTYGQILSERVHIISVDREPIGELNVVLGLEDLGPVSREDLQAHLDMSEASSSPRHKLGDKSRKESSRQKDPADNDPRNNDPRMMAEYQTALELEMWKQNQEELFASQLKAKETETIKTLTEEWRKRDKEREILAKKKLEEYSQMEDKLKKTIADIEKRERQLSASETELLRIKEEHRRDHERKMVELREASRRMKEDCDHQIEIERAKVREAEEQRQTAIQQLRDAEKRYQNKENELLSYKEQQMSKPEVKLEAELSLLRVEKLQQKTNVLAFCSKIT
ncbi:centrosomal protein of 120 kDa-like isoform X2 [Dendronephthya gigantea]|uniref:centrosomal protein of 120 kDa-like isoform X2 n=1 Tax=Dendronephthya gigantea TaxID=151771 RepID=UPI00106D67CE|nr:centrosomal protein of 120 kDa-like isoform X2 [Dendronephthya gigantea]